jgi:Protein of unknown function DUF262
MPTHSFFVHGVARHCPSVIYGALARREGTMAIFDSAKARLAELLKQIETGKLQLPDFQRGWVWNDENIRSLLATIASEFPIGAVMLFEKLQWASRSL